MADDGDHLTRARDYHASYAWRQACDEFRAAGGPAGLGVEDLEYFAECAQIVGLRDDAIAALVHAFEERAANGQVRPAVAAAFWLWQAYRLNGEDAQANGWLARARELGPDDAGEEPGWLLITAAYYRMGAGAYDDAVTLLARARDGAARMHDADQLAFSALLTGRALVLSGRFTDGLDWLDDGMLRVLAGETTPRTTSLLYCAAIGTCEMEVHDVARVREWSAALGSWLEKVPPFGGPFYGHCLTYHAVHLRLAGKWTAALAQLEDACRSLAEGAGSRFMGHARYELGESHRLFGDFPEAEAAYRTAAFTGGPTQPGLAQLRLSLGDVPAAAAGIRRALGEAVGPAARVELLPAAVTVLLAADAAGEAEAATAELGSHAEHFASDSVRATHARALGELALASNEWRKALPQLREAAGLWRDLDVPYETAQCSVLLASAYRGVGDDEAADLELEAARQAFRSLGARHDLLVVQGMLQHSDIPGQHGLSPREVGVLRLIVQGMPNRAIGAELFLSERTVQRHVSNIFNKLGVSSRTQAATLALDRGIVSSAPRGPLPEN
ncbi:response regulator transcription factor [Pseudarthrobacter sp. L1SW]|uniref:response regulator transcription factor n=1 Tax=Pseudarthrobacter sp. L1SW TaxID=2851598 RepID=UPI001E52E935|nr:response regulator transcription factor [Pseudarthrobacter sp. L1SW]UEL29451.1 response regulator transcription factor [Pseudarthrobacter sp. L1SW]